MANRRRIRMDRFNAQIAEKVIGPDSLVELEIDKGQYVTVKLPVLLHEDDDFTDRIAAAQDGGGDAIALVIMDFDPTRTAEEQLKAWKDAGLTSRDLAVVYAAETNEARERLGNFRFNA